MEEQKFELDLHMSEKGIVCNAQTLKGMLPMKLKPYNYVVTINNYADAKVDRAKLNDLCNVIQAKRKQFEETELAYWKTQKAIIMDMEKMIKDLSNKLGDGIKAIDEKEKTEKMEKVRESYCIVAESMPLEIPFERLYDRKTYDAKKWTIKKIQEDLTEKVKKITQDWNLLTAYLPSDEGDKEQVKNVFVETLDVGIAKSKADDLKAIRAKASQQQAQTDEEPKQYSEHPQIQVGEPNLMNYDKKQRVVAEFVAVRAFYDEMNVLVKKYGAAVKVMEREDL